MLAHTAYFESLASVEDEASQEWKSTLAGLVVLRLVDNWLELGTQVVTTEVTGLQEQYETLLLPYLWVTRFGQSLVQST